MKLFCNINNITIVIGMIIPFIIIYFVILKETEWNPIIKKTYKCNSIVPEGYLFGVYYTTKWGLPFNLTIGDQCKYKCQFIFDRECVDEAEALIFHVRDINKSQIINKLPEKKTNQKWILWNREPPTLDLPIMNDSNILSLFDYFVNYRLDADFSFPLMVNMYPELNETQNNFIEKLQELIVPLNDSFREKSASVLWIGSNCHSSSGRELYIKELMKYIPIHSAGKCLNNHKLPDEYDSLYGVYKFAKKYKFYLSMENSNCDNYVTEKLFRTLAVGVVPIVDGPLDYSPFVPNNRSIIRVDDFSSPKELAEYLNKLDKNDTLYMEYLEYRKNTSIWTDQFKNLLQNFNNPWKEHCKLCEKLHLDKQVHKNNIVLDNSCQFMKWGKYK